MSDDAVRNELMEQLPVIVRLCHSVSQLNTVGTFLPVIVRYLTDTSSQVDLRSLWYIVEISSCVLDNVFAVSADCRVVHAAAEQSILIHSKQLVEHSVSGMSNQQH